MATAALVQPKPFVTVIRPCSKCIGDSRIDEFERLFEKWKRRQEYRRKMNRGKSPARSVSGSSSIGPKQQPTKKFQPFDFQSPPKILEVKAITILPRSSTAGKKQHVNPPILPSIVSKPTIASIARSKNPAGEANAHQPFKWKLNQRNRSTTSVRLVPIRSGSSSRKSTSRREANANKTTYDMDEGFGSNGSSSSSTSSANNANVVVVDVGSAIQDLHKKKLAPGSGPGLVITEAEPIDVDYGEITDLQAPTLNSHPVMLRSNTELVRESRKVANEVMDEAAQELSEENPGIIFDFKRFEQ